jgi:small subunit ribosomal protein S8
MINSHSTDFLIRLKNGYNAKRSTITAPASKFCINLAEIVKKHGYIADYTVTGDIQKTITLKLEYQNDIPKIQNVQLFSKPGRRFYENSNNLPWGKTKNSLIIVSTSSGLMSQRQAKKNGLGGEIIAEIS